MKRVAAMGVLLLLFGAAKVPFEARLEAEQRAAAFRPAKLDLPLREQIGQSGFLAALGGFRSAVAAVLFIEAYTAWERLEWGRMAGLLKTVTTLQPRSETYWDSAAWNMGYNAATAAINDRSQPSEILRRRSQRQYLDLGRQFFEGGIANNPNSRLLHERFAIMLRDKYEDHCAAAAEFARAASLPGALPYVKRMAAYELAQCPGHERDAYTRLLHIYNAGEQERKPRVVTLLKELETKLGIPEAERIKETKVP